MSIRTLPTFLLCIASVACTAQVDSASESTDSQGRKASSSTLKSPTRGVVSDPFGSTMNRTKPHSGIDIAAPEGTPIYAPADGRIIRRENGCTAGDMGCGKRYGNHLELQLGDGTLIFFAHLKKTEIPPFKDGESVAVRKCQFLGEMGTTGRSSGPHLHLEFNPGGGAVADPARHIAFSNHCQPEEIALAETGQPLTPASTPQPANSGTDGKRCEHDLPGDGPSLCD